MIIFLKSSWLILPLIDVMIIVEDIISQNRLKQLPIHEV